MTTDNRFLEHVTDQAGLGDRFLSRKMFGEYGFHLDGKFIALACNNSFFLKETLPRFKGAPLPSPRLDQ